MIGIIIAVFVAILWSLGEVSYSKVSKKHDKTNVYLYTFFIRTIIYLGIVLLFRRNLFGTFNSYIFSSMLPIILCDLLASLVINIAVYNGKLSVVSPIMAAYPVLDILLGMLLLKEGASIIELSLVLLISISIIFLAAIQTKSSKAPNPIKGIIFSVLYMLLVAFSTYFEKTAYNSSFSIFDLYYYKGMVYLIVSLTFGVIILLTPNKLKKPDWGLIKGCGITPIGNVFYSFALTCGNMMIITPISSLYSVFTHYISRIYLKESMSGKEKIFILIIIFSTILLITLKIFG